AAQGADESQALLVRRVRVRRRRRRGGWLCGGACFVVGLLLIAALGSSLVYVVRRMVPPSWDWQCAGLAPAVDRTFAFDGAALAGGALGVESTNGVAITHVHVVRAANASRSAVEVRAVVEARPGAKWTGRIAVDSELRDAVPWVAVRVQRPGWEWPRDCVRAVIYVTVPPADERRLPANTHLHIAAGAGSLSALDPGRLALAGLSVDMRSGPVQVHGLAIAGPIAVSTASGRVNATRLSADSVSVTTANAAVALSQVAVRGTLSAVTSNASIRTADVTADRAQLRTTNGALQLHAVAAQVLSAQTSNGAVHGDAVVGEAAAVHTTNAA
ncbi:hypothetical protein IWQ57_007025, partial [Coemansia nantahalensis]